MGERVRTGAPRSFFSREDADREWLVFLFASFAHEDVDLNTLVARRAERELKMRSRPGLFPARDPRNSPRSPGRRLTDLLGRLGSRD